MAAEETKPHGLTKYGSTLDPFPGREGYNLMIEKLNLIPSCGIGPLSSRPAPSAGIRFWIDEATRRLSVNLGAEWAGIAELGGVLPSGVSVDPLGHEGTSDRAARADHRHALILANSSQHGAMAKEDKSKLDASTPSNSANRIIQRDSEGRAQVNNPALGKDIANKDYADFYAGSTGTQANRVMRRDENGRAQAAPAQGTFDLVTKGVVDLQINPAWLTISSWTVGWDIRAPKARVSSGHVELRGSVLAPSGFTSGPAFSLPDEITAEPKRMFVVAASSALQPETTTTLVGTAVLISSDDGKKIHVLKTDQRAIHLDGARIPTAAS